MCGGSMEAWPCSGETRREAVAKHDEVTTFKTSGAADTLGTIEVRFLFLGLAVPRTCCSDENRPHEFSNLTNNFHMYVYI